MLWRQNMLVIPPPLSASVGARLAKPAAFSCPSATTISHYDPPTYVRALLRLACACPPVLVSAVRVRRARVPSPPILGLASLGAPNSVDEVERASEAANAATSLRKSGGVGGTVSATGVAYALAAAVAATAACFAH